MTIDIPIPFECPYLEASLRQEFSSRFGEYSNVQEITLADMARLNSDLGGEDGNLKIAKRLVKHQALSYILLVNP